ncbi:biliverdin-producing heme oxygenase [Dyadobacter sandarakinus]|uniref:Biliverdin-producing heme oxygenase n=1 Tax=Dyadobacter sandarakinus TaxID=2747268 RepID=A0ABX7I7Q7_9BACT|nr:biliverdin-producing heme oxygenase [Dyadobacter sandarakinus]QRR02126.1 biliverdin-producing heme oxygenase [Dyadobacter sandarakinus]
MQDSTGLGIDPNTFINELRTQTSESHQQLEENMLSKALLLPEVSLADYQTYLSRLYSITLGCETHVFPAIATIFPDLAERYRAARIKNDLIVTGFSAEEVDNIPVPELPFTGQAGAAGVMYVLEGSTLGGRVIYKHVQQHLGLTCEHGASYFCGYGPQTGSMWKAFVSRLTAYADSPEKAGKIIESATQTFTLIDNWLSEAVIESKR